MTATEPAATGDLGDGPSSHDTCGQFPADEVAATFPGPDPEPHAAEQPAPPESSSS